MLRLFTAGLFAGGVQTMAVTLTAILSLRYGALGLAPMSASISTEAQTVQTAVLLRGFDLLIALGLALSANRFVDATALRLRQASRRMYPGQPDYACRALLVQLMIAAFGSAIVA